MISEKAKYKCNLKLDKINDNLKTLDYHYKESHIILDEKRKYLLKNLSLLKKEDDRKGILKAQIDIVKIETKIRLMYIKVNKQKNKLRIKEIILKDKISGIDIKGKETVDKIKSIKNDTKKLLNTPLGSAIYNPKSFMINQGFKLLFPTLFPAFLATTVGTKVWKNRSTIKKFSKHYKDQLFDAEYREKIKKEKVKKTKKKVKLKNKVKKKKSKK